MSADIPDYAGVRSLSINGNCITVSLPKRELEQQGYDLDDLKGKNVRCELSGRIFRAVLPE